MSIMDHKETLASLRSLQKRELTIIRLAEPVLSSTKSQSGTKRESDASSSNASENPTPASVAADLNHYKELFSKLRFSYLEQVTKEKFLRAIVGDSPLIVEHADNVQLEKELAVSKASLKAQKEEVAAMTAELEAIGRDLASRYEAIQLQTTQLETLPAEITQLESKIARLQAQQEARQNSDPTQNLSLPATQALLQERDTESEQLDAQIRALQASIPKQTRELELLEAELRPLEMQKQQAISVARDALRRKERGEQGIGDDLEMKGRWYAAAQSAMGSMLGTEA